MNQQKKKKVPEIDLLYAELNRVRYQNRFYSVLRSTVFTLVTVAAAAVLVSMLLLPVLQVYGNSMTPTLKDGEIILTVKTSKFEPGDVIAFYYNNKILVKRVIARSGEWVDIDEEGNVFINQTLLEESYLDEKALGECDIELPYQVPDGRLFVMGDHRSTSVDSRSTSVGCVAQEQIVGKILFRVWPLSNFGFIK